MRLIGLVVALLGLGALVAVLGSWQLGAARIGPWSQLKLDRDAPFELQTAAAGDAAARMDSAYPLASWLVPRDSLGYRVGRMRAKDADWKDLEYAVNDVSAYPDRFAEAALFFAGACALLALGGLLVYFRWPRLGGLLMMASFGPAAMLEHHRTPTLAVIPFALLGLVALATAPRAVKPADPARRAVLEAAVAKLLADGPLKFELTGAFWLNFILGAVAIFPPLIFWTRKQTYPVVLDRDGVVTQKGARHRWADLAAANKRTFRKRGWNIGNRLIELDFVTGPVTIEETALRGPFEKAWESFP